MDIKKSSTLARLGFWLALFFVATALIAGLGNRADWWEFNTTLTILYTAYIGTAITLVVNLAGLYSTGRSKVYSGFLLSVIGLFVALTFFTITTVHLQRALALPAIHDISTNTQDPPQFQSLLATRQASPNGAQYAGPQAAKQQQAAYPDITSLTLAIEPQQAFAKALKTADDLGWAVIASEPDNGIIEATDTTFWFGPKADIIVRVRPHNGGSIIDVRSVSRTGQRDAGTNAKRIRLFIKEMKP